MVIDPDPLQVRPVVRSTGTQRPDVIDLPAGAGAACTARRWAGVGGAEGTDLGLAARGGRGRQAKTSSKMAQLPINVGLLFFGDD